MKTYLFLCAFVCSTFSIHAQNATQSIISFDYVNGLNKTNQLELDSVYHHMNDLNYHCFVLVNNQELGRYQPTKLLQLTKARAITIQNYYTTEKGVDLKNIFIKYGGNFPTLWLFKPKSKLIASGEINLDENTRQCYSFNPSTDKIITSANGNQFYFPPNAFETMKGVTIVNQIIEICLYEFMDKKSLVFSGLTTGANGKMLETGCSFYIEAKLNGEKLRLKKGENYTVKMPFKASFPDMFTYYGGKKDGIIDWEVNLKERAIANGNIPQQEVTKVQEIVVNEEDEYMNERVQQSNNMLDSPYEEEAVDFYELSAGKLGWINCDRFYEAKHTSTLAIRVDSDKAMVVRLVFRDINSVMPCYSNSNHLDQYEATGIPTGEKVLVLAYSVKDDTAILGYKEITVGENKTEFITLNNLTKTRFEGAVAELLY